MSREALFVRRARPSAWRERLSAPCEGRTGVDVSRGEELGEPSKCGGRRLPHWEVDVVYPPRQQMRDNPAEMTAEPTTVPAPTPSPRTGTLATWLEVMLRPSTFFESIRDDRRFGPPIAFAYAMVTVAWLITTVALLTGVTPLGKQSLGEMLVFTAVKAVQLPLEAGFIGGLALTAIAHRLGSREGTYRQSVGVCCYSMAAYPAGCAVGALGRLVSPSLGMAAGGAFLVYGVYIAASGTIVVHRLKRNPTLLVFGVLGLAFMGMFTHVINRAPSHAATPGDPDAAVAPKR